MKDTVKIINLAWELQGKAYFSTEYPNIMLLMHSFAWQQFSYQTDFSLF